MEQIFGFALESAEILNVILTLVIGVPCAVALISMAFLAFAGGRH